MEKPVVIITRSQPGADFFAARVAALGYTPVVMPLLAAEATNAPAPVKPSEVAGIILTSAQALRFIDAATWTSVRVHTVGRATSDAARAAGFDVHDHDTHDVASLGACVRALNPQGTWLHIAGEDLAQGTDEALSQIGDKVIRWAVYRTRTLPFDTALLGQYAAKPEGCCVTIHSAKAGRAFAAYIQGAVPPVDSRKMNLLCLSGGVVESVSSASGYRTYVPPTPDEDALINLLGDL